MTRTWVSSKPTSPEAVLAHLEPGADIVMPNANREPVELGVTELRRKTLRQRAEALIGIADPRFRDGLSAAARQMALI